MFKQLKDANYQDPHGPASLQFDGSGSYGNGGAMRIVPAALFGYHMNEEHLNVSLMVSLNKKCKNNASSS